MGIYSNLNIYIKQKTNEKNGRTLTLEANAEILKKNSSQ